MGSNKLKILKDLKSRLSISIQDNLKDVVLFGSQLTNKATPESDYDILIVLKNKPDWTIERKISDICYEIDLQYGIITDTHLITEKEIETLRGKQPIFHNALINGYHA